MTIIQLNMKDFQEVVGIVNILMTAVCPKTRDGNVKMGVEK